MASKNTVGRKRTDKRMEMRSNGCKIAEAGSDQEPNMDQQADQHLSITAAADDPIFVPSREQAALGTVPNVAALHEQYSTMEQRPDPKPEATATGSEEKTGVKEPAFGAYCPEKLGFDPTKDLNLPGSYDEVVKRFNRLQGDRALEVLN